MSAPCPTIAISFFWAFQVLQLPFTPHLDVTDPITTVELYLLISSADMCLLSFISRCSDSTSLSLGCFSLPSPLSRFFTCATDSQTPFSRACLNLFCFSCDLRRRRRGYTLPRRRHQCWNVYGSKILKGRTGCQIKLTAPLDLSKGS